MADGPAAVLCPNCQAVVDNYVRAHPGSAIAARYATREHCESRTCPWVRCQGCGEWTGKKR